MIPCSCIRPFSAGWSLYRNALAGGRSTAGTSGDCGSIQDERRHSCSTAAQGRCKSGWTDQQTTVCVMFSSCSKSNLKYHPSSRLQQGALCYVRPNSVPQPSHPLRGWRQQHATAAHRRQPHTAEPSVRQRHKGLLLDKPLQCDPAADDLDMLAVQAAAVVQGTSSSADSRGHDLDMSRSLEAPRAQASDMQVLKPTSRAAGPAALQTTVPQGAGKRPRFTAADKLQLSEAEAKDIARRLRTPQAPEPGRPVLRIFRLLNEQSTAAVATHCLVMDRLRHRSGPSGSKDSGPVAFTDSQLQETTVHNSPHQPSMRSFQVWRR